jgi:hypothetical protein
MTGSSSRERLRSGSGVLWWKRLLLLTASIFTALFVIDTLIWAFDLDWRLFTRVFPRVAHEQAVHEPSPDPRLLYRLKPSSRAFYKGQYGPYWVSVNSLGFRGPERKALKPPGVFRILCLGGSNVYGQFLNDDSTWPAQLEKRLNATSPGRYEVWNLGVCGYNGYQMAVQGADAVAKYQPDLVIFALSNWGTRLFYIGTNNFEKYFDGDPLLWQDFLASETKERPGWDFEVKRFILSHSALARLVEFTNYSLRTKERGRDYYFYHHIEAGRQFLSSMKDRVHVAVFLCPAVRPNQYEPYFRGINVPVFKLDPKDKNPISSLLHPPAESFAYYAESLETWLHALQLLPPR